VATTSSPHPAADPHPAGDLLELARPFPTDFVERKDGSDYVAHHVVNQRLLSIVGPFDFELVQVIRGDVAAVPPDSSARSRRAKAGTPALQNVVVGGIWRITCVIDGRQVRVEEVGDVGDLHNWPHDGARLKDAASDALKRCAMRLGLGLHLWAQEHYFLYGQLQAPHQDGTAAKAQEAAAGSERATDQPTGRPAPDRPGPRRPAGRPSRRAGDPDAAASSGGARAASADADGQGLPPRRGATEWRRPLPQQLRRLRTLAAAGGVDDDRLDRYVGQRYHADRLDDLHRPTVEGLVTALERDGGPAAFKTAVDGLVGESPARASAS
jgi:hypothetical protein